MIDGWAVIRFSYDQVKKKPRQYQLIVQHVMYSNYHLFPFSKGKWIRKGEVISPKEVGKYLELSDKTVKKVLSQLVDKKLMIPASGVKRGRTYRFGDQVKHQITQLDK